MDKPPRNPPPPAWAVFHAAPRSSKHGKHRRSSSAAHSSPADGTSEPNTGANPQIAHYLANPSFAFRGAVFPEYAPLDPNSTPHAGIRAGELIGYRCWYVDDGFNLHSVSADYVWPTDAPAEGNPGIFIDSYPFLPAGVYAFNDEERARQQLIEYVAGQTFPFSWIRQAKIELILVRYIGVVYGEVKLWGEVHEHEHGYRAQYAKITAVHTGTFGWTSSRESCLPNIRKRYGL